MIRATLGRAAVEWAAGGRLASDWRVAPPPQCRPPRRRGEGPRRQCLRARCAVATGRATRCDGAPALPPRRRRGVEASVARRRMPRGGEPGTRCAGAYVCPHPRSPPPAPPRRLPWPEGSTPSLQRRPARRAHPPAITTVAFRPWIPWASMPEMRGPGGSSTEKRGWCVLSIPVPSVRGAVDRARSWGGVTPGAGAGARDGGPPSSQRPCSFVAFLDRQPPCRALNTPLARLGAARSISPSAQG